MNERSIVFITGAGSGIGRSAVRLFASRGWRVAAAVRKESDVAHIRAVNEDIQVFVGDLADPSQVERMGAEALARLGRVDVLVNNAGHGLRGAVEESDPEAVRRLFEVNVFAPCLLAKAFLPGMRERRGGRIVNVSSVTGIFASPFNGFYAASKHALEGWSDSMRMEVERFGVFVSLIQIGPVATRFLENAEDHSREVLENPTSPYRLLRERSADAVAEVNKKALSSERVARLILKIAESKRPRARYRMHKLARIAPFLLFFTPRRWLDYLLQRRVGLR